MKGALLPMLVILSPFLLFSQHVERLEKQAAALLEKADFTHALQLYEAVEKMKPGDPDALCHIGVCHFENNNLTAAAAYLNRSLETGKEIPPTAYRYLGKWHHAHLDFEKAIDFYKIFLKNSPDKEPYRAAVKDDILRCANGKMVRRQPPIGSIVHLGSPVNTAADEYRPLHSPNHPAVLYFASDRRQNTNGSFASDIYSTERENGAWSTPSPLGLALNTTAFEEPLGFGFDGSVLYFFRGNTSFSGDILVDTFTENILEKNMPHAEFISPMRTWEGDCDPHFFNDTTLLFASRRPGGFGGLDIYITLLTGYGWTPPANLGPIINSAYDDRSPFLAPDGVTLYFSTNDARRSTGGLDIMKSIFLERVNKWTPAENLGIPFNSADDDECFSLSENGRSALFASSRKSGFGKRDLYMGIFPENNHAQQLSAGIPTLNGNDNYGSHPTTGNLTDSLAIITTNFTIRPVRHAGPLLPLAEDGLKELRKLAFLLKSYPLARVVLVGYATEGERNPLQVAKVLDQAVAFLQAEQVNQQQVKWLAAPAKFSPQKNGPRAIDIFIANPEILPTGIKLVWTEGKTFESTFFIKSLQNLVYQVQVPLGETASASEVLKFYPDGMLIKDPSTGSTFCATGYHLSWTAALEAEKSIRQFGFAQAVTVPVLNGWELNKAMATRHLHEYPELELFIERD